MAAADWRADPEHDAYDGIRAKIMSLVTGALSELGSLDETRTLLRSFVVPSLGLGRGV